MRILLSLVALNPVLFYSTLVVSLVLGFVLGRQTRPGQRESLIASPEVSKKDLSEKKHTELWERRGQLEAELEFYLELAQQGLLSVFGAKSLANAVATYCALVEQCDYLCGHPECTLCRKEKNGQ